MNGGRRLGAFAAVWLAIFAVSMLFAWRVAPASEPERVGRPFEEIVPKSFGDWAWMPEATAAVVNPQQAATITQIYDETVSRTYRNKRTGSIVMLSIAYGRDQSHKNQVHKPEWCYPAQGYALSHVQAVNLPVLGATLPATRLEAKLAERDEFVQYWMLQGDRPIRGAFEQNMNRALNALSGVRADGLLFRTSVIANDPADAYAQQGAFVDALLAAVPMPERARLMGAAVAPAARS